MVQNQKNMKYYKGKFEFVKSMVQNDKVLLDLGCRDNVLKTYLPPSTKYTGMDLFQNNHQGVDVLGNIEDGLPFEDFEFDYIVALDLFEHLNDMQKAMSDTIKKLKSKGKLIIQLPNMSYFIYRWDILINGRLTITDKYKLTYNYGLDRHRWFTTMIETDEFMHQFSKSNGLDFKKFAIVSPKLKFIGDLLTPIGIKEYSYSNAVIYVLEKP